jgi:hypothetical protein
MLLSSPKSSFRLPYQNTLYSISSNYSVHMPRPYHPSWLDPNYTTLYSVIFSIPLLQHHSQQQIPHSVDCPPPNTTWLVFIMEIGCFLWRRKWILSTLRFLLFQSSHQVPMYWLATCLGRLYTLARVHMLLLHEDVETRSPKAQTRGQINYTGHNSHVPATSFLRTNGLIEQGASTRVPALVHKLSYLSFIFRSTTKLPDISHVTYLLHPRLTWRNPEQTVHSFHAFRIPHPAFSPSFGRSNKINFSEHSKLQNRSLCPPFRLFSLPNPSVINISSSPVKKWRESNCILGQTAITSLHTRSVKMSDGKETKTDTSH